MTSDKLIICVSPASNFQGKEANPALPYSPEEIAEEVYKCWNEGAAIVHIHCRDKDGLPTNDPEYFHETAQRIREKKCDIIIQNSTATANAVLRGIVTPLPPDEGLRSVEANPEMATLSMGLLAMMYKGKSLPPAERTRPWIEKAAKMMMHKGIKPELEIYNHSMMEEVYNLIDKELLTKPYWLSFVMHMHRVVQGGLAYTPKALMYYLDILPPDSMFSVIAIGTAELPATTMSILLGGHLRVGFEDNIYYKRGVLAESNAQLVARSARIGRELGREPATPDDAREVLGIPKLGK